MGSFSPRTSLLVSYVWNWISVLWNIYSYKLNRFQKYEFLNPINANEYQTNYIRFHNHLLCYFCCLYIYKKTYLDNIKCAWTILSGVLSKAKVRPRFHVIPEKKLWIHFLLFDWVPFKNHQPLQFYSQPIIFFLLSSISYLLNLILWDGGGGGMHMLGYYIC